MSYFYKLLNIFQDPLMALGVQHFIIIRQIVENTVTVELSHGFIAGEMLAVFVLLYTKRHEIRYVLLFVHNSQLQRYYFLSNQIIKIHKSFLLYPLHHLNAELFNLLYWNVNIEIIQCYEFDISNFQQTNSGIHINLV